MKKSFLIIFTIFSIVIPIGIQPQLQTTEAFDQSVIDDNISDKKDYRNDKSNNNDGVVADTDINKNIMNSNIPALGTKVQDLHNSMKSNVDIINHDNLNDISSQSSSNSSSILSSSLASDSLSSVSSNESYDDSNINDVDDNIIVQENIPDAELSPTETQIDTVNSNNNMNANGKLNENLPDDNSSDESTSNATSQSQASDQPRYKSYRDFMDKNTKDNGIDLEQSSMSVEESSSSDLIYHSSKKVYGDFNGDGFDDLAIGVPFEDVDRTGGTVSDAGAVNVIYGSSIGLSATSARPDLFLTQDSPDVNDFPEANDNFGSSLSSGDFNGDGKDDLAIGVPGETLVTGAGIVPGAGAVNVIYGSSIGLSATSARPDLFLTQDSPDVNDTPENGDNFGSSLSSGDFNDDGKDDLAIGVPLEDAGTGQIVIVNTGAVNVIYGSSIGLSATSARPDQFWTQSSTDVNDVAEDDDEFGSSLSSGDFNGDGKDDLAIGVIFENVRSTDDNAGAVNVIHGSSNGLSATSPLPDQFWTQDNADVHDFPEFDDHFGSSLSTGDFNGDGKDDLAIGVSSEDVGTGVDGAGAVNVIHGSSNGLSATSPLPDQFWTQTATDVNDVAEDDDKFGSSLTSGDFNGDGKDDLAIGVPDEGVDTGAGIIDDAGAVNVIYGSSIGLSATSPKSDQFWTQESPEVNDSPEDSDNFGFSLSSGDYNNDGKDDLAIGVPDEDVITPTDFAGAVNVIYGSSIGLSATSPKSDQFWTQSSTDVNDVAEDTDGFGSSLG